MNKVNKSHDRNLSPPTQKSSIIIRMIRIIRVRFISERNNHNYHNYPRNNILSFLSLTDPTDPTDFFRLFSDNFRFFRYKIYSRQSPRELFLSLTELTIFFISRRNSGNNRKGYARHAA